MDAVEILLLCVVGFSVLVFLILNGVDSLEKSIKKFNEAKQSSEIYDSVSKTRIDGESAEGSVHREDRKSVGADGKAENQLVSENFRRVSFQENAEGEETENTANASDERSDFCSGFSSTSGNKGDKSCRINEGISDDVDGGEGEEGFLDDWEGIQRTDLEKTFGEAMVFVSCKSNAVLIDEDVKLQLYGLQKVALEGPCRGPQPMALNVSARSKWSAWKQLGNMSREMAMEKYIDILSEAIPEWKGERTTIKDAVTSEDNKYGAEVER